ncbi:unnamed protein product [Rotaria magnacalcarata]|uniref:Transposase n=1 Tax=Rotaria magnacalcarata TaxID=392030 RepID=A0A816XPD0_9BILA|nr:unnamed protein product [Rotaria magnacalcarata]CAF2209684.1 unnamed protein product [Rotaria magnacalcarata]
METSSQTVEVPTYVSDDEINTSETIGKSNKNNMRRRRNWMEEKVFNNAEEAEMALQEKNYYRCSKVKARGKQFDASIYLLFDSTSDKVILFRTTSDHVHHSMPEKPSRISNEVKQAIQELFELKLKPKAIMEVLHEREIKPPSISQLSNFLRNLKNKTLGSTSISLGEIEQWCIESIRSSPESIDSPFVASYEVIYEDDIENEDDDDVNVNKCRFFITTKRLLQIAARSKKTHADATYKLVWQGFPILIAGTTDLDRHFHSFVMTTRGEEDRINGGQIRTRRFGDDIELLQLAQTEQMFFKASNLFIKKWMKKQPIFINYFQDEWLTTLHGWYEGVGHFTPSTNNALESTNNVMKKERTLRERLPLSRFKVLACEIVEKWSKSYERGLK